MALMREYRVTRLKAGGVEVEMTHVLSLESDAADVGPSFKDITGIDPLGTPRERNIAARLAEAARVVTEKDIEDEDRYAD